MPRLEPHADRHCPGHRQHARSTAGRRSHREGARAHFGNRPRQRSTTVPDARIHATCTDCGRGGSTVARTGMQFASGIAAGVFTSGWALDRPTAAALVLDERFSLKPCGHAISPLLSLASATPPSDWLTGTPRFRLGVRRPFLGKCISRNTIALATGAPEHCPLFQLATDRFRNGHRPVDGTEAARKTPEGRAVQRFSVETLGNQPATRHLIRALPSEMREAPAHNICTICRQCFSIQHLAPGKQAVLLRSSTWQARKP